MVANRANKSKRVQKKIFSTIFWIGKLLRFRSKVRRKRMLRNLKKWTRSIALMSHFCRAFWAKYYWTQVHRHVLLRAHLKSWVILRVE